RMSRYAIARGAAGPLVAQVDVGDDRGTLAWVDGGALGRECPTTDAHRDHSEPRALAAVTDPGFADFVGAASGFAVRVPLVLGSGLGGMGLSTGGAPLIVKHRCPGSTMSSSSRVCWTATTLGGQTSSFSGLLGRMTGSRVSGLV